MSDPSIYGDYGILEANAIKKRKQRSIANTQSAQLGQLRGQRSMAELTKKFQEGFQPAVGSYGRRGFGGPNVQSGIRTAGLERYAQDMQKALGTETQRQQDELNAIQANEAQAQNELEDYLAQLRFEKSKAIMADALNIKSLASY